MKCKRYSGQVCGQKKVKEETNYKSQDGKGAMGYFGGPEGIRTLDLFHAMEARSQLRHRPTS